jgi:hypothetical protein
VRKEEEDSILLLHRRDIVVEEEEGEAATASALNAKKRNSPSLPPVHVREERHKIDLSLPLSTFTSHLFPIRLSWHTIFCSPLLTARVPPSQDLGEVSWQCVSISSRLPFAT